MNLLKLSKNLKLAVASGFLALSMVAAPLVVGTLNASQIFADANFSGSSYLVSNTQNPAWASSVSANPGDVVQFKAELDNQGAEPAHNVRVRADFPQGVSGTSVSSTIHVVADNAGEITMSVPVNVACPLGGTCTLGLTYFPGHAVLIQHPGNAQSTIESIGGGGWVSVGDLDNASNAFDEVLFKATVVQSVNQASPPPSIPPSPSPSPSVSPSPSPSPTPTALPSISPSPSPSSGTIQCAAGQTVVVVNGQMQCQNQSQSQSQGNQTQTQTNNQNVTVNAQGQPAVLAAAAQPQVVATAPVQTQTLPKTGLPLAGWALAGLLPVGAKLKRFGKTNEEDQTANFIWEEREFKKD